MLPLTSSIVKNHSFCKLIQAWSCTYTHSPKLNCSSFSKNLIYCILLVYKIKAIVEIKLDPSSLHQKRN